MFVWNQLENALKLVVGEGIREHELLPKAAEQCPRAVRTIYIARNFEFRKIKVASLKKGDLIFSLEINIFFAKLIWKLLWYKFKHKLETPTSSLLQTETELIFPGITDSEPEWLFPWLEDG